MNYLSGIALGLSAGQQLYQMWGKESCTLVHSLPGRRRYYYKGLQNNTDLVKRWQARWPQIPGIHKVHFSVETATILIEYSCDDAVIHKLMEYLDQLYKYPDSTSLYGKVGLDIRKNAFAIDRNLFHQSGRLMDLRTFFALVFILWGGVRFFTAANRASCMQLFWWAYSLLKGRA